MSYRYKIDQDTVSANTVLAGPNGSSGAPGYRALVTTDLPSGINAATNVVVATSTNSTFYPTVVNAVSGNLVDYTVSTFSINPFTGLLTVAALSSSGAISATTRIYASGIGSYTPSTGTTVTIDCSLGNLFIITLPASGTAVTFGTPSNPQNGQSINVIFIQGATTGTTVTMPANTVIKFAGASKTIPTTTSTIHLMSMVYSSAGYWMASLATNFG